MLIITRKKNESIIIDLGEQQIEILVADIGKQVRIGISAPKECKILRKELYTTIQENKQAAEEAETKNLRNLLLQFKQQKASE